MMASRNSADRSANLPPGRRGAPRPPGIVRTVLVADSDLNGRARIAELLAAEGYHVMVAASGDEALALIRHSRIDLLVSAMVMDSMDGLELLRALRDAGINLPAVAVASGREEIDGIYLRGAALLGVARTYMQPLSPGAFLEDIRTLLRPQSS